jgi:hypothetical protein
VAVGSGVEFGGVVGTGVGVAVGVGVGVAPTAVGVTFGVGVGATVGGSGAVGQPWSSGLNGVGVADGVGTGVGAGVAVGLPLTAGEGVAVGTGVGVTTYGVYEGHGGAEASGAECVAEIPREIATATAPTRIVTTKVIAPHSRRIGFMQRPTCQ